MLSFKQFLENLWGNIPSTQRKPSDGIPNADKLTMSKSGKSGGSGGMGMPPMPAMPAGKPMMMKKMEKQ